MPWEVFTKAVMTKVVMKRVLFQVESGDHWRLQAAQTHVYEERVFPEQAGFAIQATVELKEILYEK